MAGLCKVIVVGNLGRDPEKRYTQDGRALARFSVAATTRKKDRDGTWQDHTEWFNVTTFGRQAEALAERLTKGSRVYVEGRLESRTYEAASGGKGFAMDILANEVLSLDSRPRGEGEFAGFESGSEPAPASERAPARGGYAPRPPTTEDVGDLDDLPF